VLTYVRRTVDRNTDLVNKPDRFFLAHRLLAEHAPQLGPGFWIRMTVHLNLCAGTVLGLGNDSQVAMLDEWQEKGFLGCFSLTEKLAGVNSGLVVNTVATYDEAADEFVLNSPDRGAWKNWISQGLVADKTVVVASLVLKGKPLGPHAFVMDLRQNGSVVSGVELEDMGRKTIGNDLDNAAIAFHGVRLPRSALLNRFADIEGGEYVQKVKGMPVFHMIGQRLFSGRVAVAQAALGFRELNPSPPRVQTQTSLYAPSSV
jgi:acyl-CoA oxidase